MKVLFFDLQFYYLANAKAYPVGGATFQLMHWLDGFVKNQAKVFVLTSKANDKPVEKYKNVSLLYAYDFKKGIKYLRWIYYRYPFLYKVIKRCKPDVVIQAKAGFSTGIVASICRLINVPFVYRVANDIELDERLKLRKNYYERLAFRYALKMTSAIICQNNYQKQQINSAYPGKSMTIIHNPFPISKKKENLSVERKYVAWLGIFQTQKNLPALYQVVKVMPEVEFRIAGEIFDPLDQASQEAVDKMKECTNVEFVGYLENHKIYDFLANASLLLCTSHYEGFSNTFLEAFAAGTPVVTTHKVDPDNIICHYHLGESVNDYNELPSAIHRIINHPDYKMLTSRCFDYVRENHDPAKLSKQYLDFLKNVLNGS